MGKYSKKQAADVQTISTLGGDYALKWDDETQMSVNAHAALLSQFAKAGGFFDRLAETCPMRLTSNNAPRVRDLIATVMVSIINGATRFRHVGLSRTLVERVSNESISSPVQKKIIEARIDEAKRLLSTTSIPVKEVATLSGFSSLHYLSRAFASATGLPPPHRMARAEHHLTQTQPMHSSRDACFNAPTAHPSVPIDTPAKPRNPLPPSTATPPKPDLPAQPMFIVYKLWNNWGTTGDRPRKEL